jgi:hypothetical protein
MAIKSLSIFYLFYINTAANGERIYLAKYFPTETATPSPMTLYQSLNKPGSLKLFEASMRLSSSPGPQKADFPAIAAVDDQVLLITPAGLGMQVAIYIVETKFKDKLV